VQSSLVLDLALRTKRLDDLVQAFAAQHPNAVVLDLGCGLDPRVIRCDLPSSTAWYDIDFPVVKIRERYLPRASHTIGADLTTSGWLDNIPRWAHHDRC
jgi:O-methyltransferase involved in polyketide biosynthesis